MRLGTTRSRSDAFDAALGAKILTRRKALGIRQEDVAAAVGVSFQQMQKYERGANRVSAYMLAKLAAALSVSVIALLPTLPPGDDPKAVIAGVGRPRARDR
jgi:transcriptional regulator with XRE-family HTH domain